MSMSSKIAKYETFINDVLKQDLRKLTEQKAALCNKIASYEQVVRTTDVIQKEKSEKPFLTQVDLGSNFYVQAEIEDPSEIIIDIGLGVHLEMSLEECTTFCKSKISSLQKQIPEFDDQIANVKAQIKFTLEALKELQQSLFQSQS